MSFFRSSRTLIALAIKRAMSQFSVGRAQTDSRLPAEWGVGSDRDCLGRALGVVGDDMITPVSSIGENELVRMCESTVGDVG